MSLLSDDELVKELRELADKTPHKTAEPVLRLAAQRIHALRSSLEMEAYRSRGMRPWMRATKAED